MKVPIDRIENNPYRDFSLYPIDQEQVDRLIPALKAHGFFQTLPVREHPLKPGYYQIAGGHHRVEAARAAGFNNVEVSIRDLNEDDMISVMETENLTQRGNSASAILGMVATRAKLVTKQILLTNKPPSENSENELNAFNRMRENIIKTGPGMPTIYKAMNGFELKQRPENKAIERITKDEIESSLSSLKQSGEMARIVNEALAEVEEIRAKRDRLEAKVIEAERAAEAAQEQQRLEAIELAKKAEEEAEASRLEAERLAKENNERLAREATEKAAEAKRRAEIAEEHRKKVDREMAERREKTLQENKEREERKRREDEEREKIQAQQELEATYDIRCVNVFKLTSHEAVFRRAVLGSLGKKIITKDNQLEFAEYIVSKGGDKITSNIIETIISQKFEDVLKMEKEIEKEDAKKLLDQKDKERVDKKWNDLRLQQVKVVTALFDIQDEYKKWPKNKPFPLDRSQLDKLTIFSKEVIKLCESLTSGNPEEYYKQNRQPSVLIEGN